MDKIELSNVSKIVLDEIANLPKKFNFGDADNRLKEDSRIFTSRILKRDIRNRFLSFQPWFLRCSWLKKVNILTRLAWCTTNLHTLILFLNTIYTATCKDYIYSINQGLNLFTCDTILNDHNRSLDRQVLEDVIEHEINYYIGLNDFEQFSILIEMIQLSDSCIIGKIFYEFVKIFKSRYREIFRIQYLEELQLRPTTSPSDKTKTKSKKKDKGKKGKSGKKDKMSKEDEAALLEKEKEKQRLQELEEIYAFLNEKIPDNSKDPDTIELISLMQKWDTFMTAYMKKVGLGPPKKESKKKDKGKKGKGKKEKISKDLPDDIQLLPIWINKKLIASIDTKTFKNATKTNKYWKFIGKGIKQDSKCRQSLNKNCAKLQNGLKIVKFETIIPEGKLAPKSTNVTDKSIRRNFKYNQQTTNTLMSDLYKTCTQFNISGTTLQSFPRRLYVPDLRLVM